MSRIGSSFGEAPRLNIRLSSNEFEQLGTASMDYEGGQALKLGPEQRDKISETLQQYVMDRKMDENTPTWPQVRHPLERLRKPAASLIRALNTLTASDGKTDREKNALLAAERLLSAHHGMGTGVDLAELLTSLYQLSMAANKAVADVRRAGKGGRDDNVALDNCLAKLLDVYKSAGGRSINLQSRTVPRKWDEVETKVSGFVFFAHACLSKLPPDLYPYHRTDPLRSPALAKRIGRLLGRKPRKRGPYLVNLVLEAHRQRRSGDQN
jgi:hypothetical protein